MASQPQGSRRFRARPIGPAIVLAVGLTLPTCFVADLELRGKACPCAPGWRCDEHSHTCVEGALPDAGVGGGDAGAGGGGAGAGGGDAGVDAAPDAGCDFVPGVSPGLEGPRGWPSCTNAIDDDCDGFSDELDADCGYVYTVVKAATPPVVDGDCSEFAVAQSLSLRADATNVIVYWLMWDDTAIYVCAAITDDSLDAANTDPILERDGNVWRDDALEIFFDVDHDAGPTMQAGDYKFFVNVFNVQTDSQGGGEDWSADFESAVTVDGTPNVDGDSDGGFTAELAVPWASWGITAPVPPAVWGGDLMWNDRDSATTEDRTFEVWSNTIGEVNTPDGFGDLVFVE